MELKEKLEKELASLIEGFDLKFNSDGFEFSRKVGSVVYFYGGNLRAMPSKLVCDHLNAGISFIEVEEFLTPILIESDILGKSTKGSEQWTIDISRNELLGKSKYNLLDLFHFEITTHGEIIELKSRIKKYFSLTVSKFFNEWTSLMDFKDSLEKLNSREIAIAFGTGGIFKKAVIFDMINHKNYCKYMDQIIDNLQAAKEANLKEVQYFRFYKAAKLVKERLRLKERPD